MTLWKVSVKGCSLSLVELHLEVRRLREQAGWSRRELEERAGLPSRALERLEVRQQQPGAEAIIRIAAALGTTAGALLGLGEQGLDQVMDGLVVRHGAERVVAEAVRAAFGRKR